MPLTARCALSSYAMTCRTTRTLDPRHEATVTPCSWQMRSQARPTNASGHSICLAPQDESHWTHDGPLSIERSPRFRDALNAYVGVCVMQRRRVPAVRADARNGDASTCGCGGACEHRAWLWVLKNESCCVGAVDERIVLTSRLVQHSSELLPLRGPTVGRVLVVDDLQIEVRER
jgi:hypothetical protein